jgi:hypothetical protein
VNEWASKGDKQAMVGDGAGSDRLLRVSDLVVRIEALLEMGKPVQPTSN